MLFAINMIKADVKNHSMREVIDQIIKTRSFVKITYTPDRNILVTSCKSNMYFIIQHIQIENFMKSINSMIGMILVGLEIYKLSESDTALYDLKAEQICAIIEEISVLLPGEDEDEEDIASKAKNKSEQEIDQDITIYLSKLEKLFHAINQSALDLKAAKQYKDAKFLRNMYNQLFIQLKKAHESNLV